MPRFKFMGAPRGLYLPTALESAPEGSAAELRNAAYLGSGVLRQAPPSLFIASPGVLRSGTRFNGRFVVDGFVGSLSAMQIRRETAPGSGSFAALTLPAGTQLADSPNPLQYVTAPPTPDKDEHLFILDTSNSIFGNAAVGMWKLSDGGTLSRWGLLPPPATVFQGAAATATKGTQQAVYVFPGNTQDPFDDASAIGTTASGEGAALSNWTLTSGDDDTLTTNSFIQVSGVVAPGSGKALKIRCEQGKVAQATRVFATPVDLTTFGGGVLSSDADFIQFWVRVRRVKHIHSLEIQFDTTDGTFTNNVLSREITFKLVRNQFKRKLIGLGDLVPPQHVHDYLRQHPNALDYSFAQQQGQQEIPIAKNAWARVTLPKNSFNPSTGIPWSSIKAVRISVHTTTEGAGAVFVDELKLVGGAGVHGDYHYTITYSSEDGTPASPGSRSNPPIDDRNGSVTGQPNSVVQLTVGAVERQPVVLSFPNGLTFDPQVRRIEIWRTVGNGAAFFRCGYITVPPNSGSLPAGYTFTDSAADYYGLNDKATQTTTTPVPGYTNTNFAVLDPSEELPLDNIPASGQGFAFQRVADRIHVGRMWWGRNIATLADDNTMQGSLGNQGTVAYSPVGRFESVQGAIQVTSGVSDPVQALAVWNDRLFVFTQLGLFEIVGADEPFIVQRLEGVPGTQYPFTVASGTDGLYWLGPDGVYRFNGQFAEVISDPALSQIFRYQTVPSLAPPGTPVTPFALLIPFSPYARGVFARNTYYLSGVANSFILAYDATVQAWRYLDVSYSLDHTNGALFLDTQSVTVFVQGTSSSIYELEPRSFPTSGTSFFSVTALPYFYAGPGKQAVLRRVLIDWEIGPNGTSTSVTSPLNVYTDTSSVGLNFSTAQSSGTRITTDVATLVPGRTFGVRLNFSGRDIRIHSIEADFYVPGQADVDAA